MDRWQIKNDYIYLTERYKNSIIIDNVGLQKIKPEEYKKYLIMPLEIYITLPVFFDIGFIRQFKGFITFSTKIYEEYKKHGINCYYLQYPHADKDYFQINNFVNYENKIKGICALYKIYKTDQAGDILYLREPFMNKLNLQIKHTYGPEKWGNINCNVQYQNIKTNPNENKSLEIRNKYIFTLALEAVYHDFWNWDIITERLWNCFRSKTLAIYLGCKNVQDYVPKEFFVDLRKYITQETPFVDFDYRRLEDDLNELMSNKIKYIKITENAYEWQQTNKFGNMNDLEKELDRIINL
jgi:hypothetical protein